MGTVTAKQIYDLIVTSADENNLPISDVIQILLKNVNYDKTNLTERHKQ